MRACCLFRSGIAYGRDYFRNGLQRLGYAVTNQPVSNPLPGDVLLLWNRLAREHICAQRYERGGARVIIAENGYVGRAADGGKLYALALGRHNGAGSWPVGGADRWQRQQITLQDWRTAGDKLLVLPQRGIGTAPVAMPYTWPNQTMGALRRLSGRPIALRRHPGPLKTEPYGDLRGSWAAITWGSGAALKALVAGYPVFHDMPDWIGASAAVMGTADIEHPYLGDREPMLARLAWAQWSAAEIESGEAFAWLLQRD